MVMLVKESRKINHLHSVSKTKVRGVLALMKHGEMLITNGNEGNPVRLYLAKGINSFKDLRERHDAFLQKYMLEHHLFMPAVLKSELIWQVDEETKTSRVEAMNKLAVSLQLFFNDLNSYPGKIASEVEDTGYDSGNGGVISRSAANNDIGIHNGGYTNYMPPTEPLNAGQDPRIRREGFSNSEFDRSSNTMRMGQPPRGIAIREREEADWMGRNGGFSNRSSVQAGNMGYSSPSYGDMSNYGGSFNRSDGRYSSMNEFSYPNQGYYPEQNMYRGNRPLQRVGSGRSIPSGNQGWGWSPPAGNTFNNFGKDMYRPDSFPAASKRSPVNSEGSWYDEAPDNFDSQSRGGRGGAMGYDPSGEKLFEDGFRDLSLQIDPAGKTQQISLDRSPFSGGIQSSMAFNPALPNSLSNNLSSETSVGNRTQSSGSQNGLEADISLRNYNIVGQSKRSPSDLDAFLPASYIYPVTDSSEQNEKKSDNNNIATHGLVSDDQSWSHHGQGDFPQTSWMMGIDGTPADIDKSNPVAN